MIRIDTPKLLALALLLVLAGPSAPGCTSSPTPHPSTSKAEGSTDEADTAAAGGTGGEPDTSEPGLEPEPEPVEETTEPEPRPVADTAGGPDTEPEPEPDSTEPDVIEPDISEPDITEPDITEPDLTEPDITEPDVTEPDITEPDVTEPDTAGDTEGGNGDPVCGSTLVSTLPGVSITFDEAPCTFTLAEAAAGITIPYTLEIDASIPGVSPSPQDAGQCGQPDASGLILFERLEGDDDQQYCLCDTGLCPGQPSPAAELAAGDWSYDFAWDGTTWFGPSDFLNPKGPPFDPGTHILTVSAKGELVDPSTGATSPFEVIATREVILVAGDAPDACDDPAQDTPIAQLCVRGEMGSTGESLVDGGHAAVQVMPEGCWSSSCTSILEASCSVTPGGAPMSLDVDGLFCLEGTGAGACTPDCSGGGWAECETTTLSAGTWIVSHGGISVTFDVPSTLPFGGVCAGSPF